MRIIDEEGNELSDVDLSKGKITLTTIIKADAAPIDNETKFAYEDSDYETVQVYKTYDKEKLSEIEAGRAQKEFLQGGNDRLTEVESANLDQDELLVDIADTVTQNQLDTDEALTTLYELMTGETNE